MQLTPSDAICPLCKRSVSADGAHSDPTRLCEDCQGIVQKVRPTSNRRAAEIPTVQARSAPRPQLALAVEGNARLSAPIFIEQTIEPFERAEHGESAQPEISAQALIESDPFDFDELFSSGSPGELTPLVSEPLSLIDVSPDLLTRAKTEPLPDAASEAQPTAYEVAEAPLAIEASSAVTLDPPSEASISDLFSDLQTASIENTEESCQDEVVTNPLEDPIQSCAYSQDDFPILVRVPDQSQMARLKLPLVAALLIGFGIAGYFLIYRPSIQASQNNPAASRVAELKRSSAPIGTAAPKTEGQENQSSETNSADRKDGQSAARGRDESSEGRFSLQAAAFPDEAGATGFADRLKRAGVPAYVVPADIAGRGRWFRVRVGRFETSKAADRFASEARQRARAVGLSLQLIVSSYDKP